MLRRRPIAVAEHNDGQVVIGKAVEFGGETWAMSLRRQQAVPKTTIPRVPPIDIVVAFHEILLLRRALQQRIRVERAIEAIEIVDRGVQKTGSRFAGPVHIERLVEPGDSGWVVTRGGEWDQPRSVAVHPRIVHSTL